jgi:hypothetical protein
LPLVVAVVAELGLSWRLQDQLSQLPFGSSAVFNPSLDTLIILLKKVGPPALRQLRPWLSSLGTDNYLHTNPTMVLTLKLFQQDDYVRAGVGLESDPTFPKRYLNSSTLGGVCRQCKNWEMGSLSYSKDWKENGKFKTWRDPPIYFSGCPTCLILWQFKGESDEARGQHNSDGPAMWLWRFNTAKLFYNDGYPFQSPPLASSASLHTETKYTYPKVGLWRKNLERTKTRPKGWFTPVENLEDASAQDYFARYPKEKIDFKLVRDWIDSCSNSGNRCNISKTEKAKFPIRVVNCLRQSVEWSCGQAPYLALSYTWGEEERVQFQSNPHGLGFLPDELPTLISDAIQATLELGYQYLWIDSYCIRQDDQVDIEQQVSQMHQIYMLAEATIIAACCSNPSEPLAGVRAGTRAVPQLIELGNHKYLPIAYPRIEESHWNTRGWTYQEAVLSRRRIVFFKEQIYFQCHCMMHLESIRMPLQSPFKNTTTIHPGDLFPSMLRHQSPRNHLFKHINAYISRDMRYEDDFLHGFMGILQWFSKEYKNSAHVTGLILLRDIPITTSSSPFTMSEKFAVSLAWHAEAAAKRRCGFPSWSWMGWHLKGTVIAEDHFYDCEALRNTHLRIDVQYNSSRVMSLQEYMDYYRSAEVVEDGANLTKVLSEHIPALVITAPLLRLSISTYNNYANHGNGRRSIVHVSEVGTMYAVVSLTSHDPWERRMFIGLVLGAREPLEIIVMLVREVENGTRKKMERVGFMILGVDPPLVEKCIRVSNKYVQTFYLV